MVGFHASLGSHCCFGALYHKFKDTWRFAVFCSVAVKEDATLMNESVWAVRLLAGMGRE